MIKTDTEVHLNCLLIEKLVCKLTLMGVNDTELVGIIQDAFAPENTEQELKYSKAILYGKFIILN
jgi:hypothetical protein